MKALLEAGVHFGHQTRRWNPRMKSFIFTQRNGIHIVDLQQTVVLLEKASRFVRDMVAEGGDIIFVGTKRQAQEAVEQEAKRCGMYFINRRWLGGMLTNFATIQSRIDYLVRLEDQKERGELSHLTKKARWKLDEKIDKLNRQLGGIKAMTAIPGAIFIVDPSKERIAVTEARKLNVPMVAIVDTNCDPDEIDYPIPGNDDAIKSVKLLCSLMADAVLEGKAARQPAEGEKEIELADKAQEAPAAAQAVPSASVPEPRKETSPGG
ncbi:MAG: 30S ribosomal protein S2 [Chloroflexota bacterium]|nr:30S ribosomal protein S2 [Chloroflexota bacterium]